MGRVALLRPVETRGVGRRPSPVTVKGAALLAARVGERVALPSLKLHCGERGGRGKPASPALGRHSRQGVSEVAEMAMENSVVDAPVRGLAETACPSSATPVRVGRE